MNTFARGAVLIAVLVLPATAQAFSDKTLFAADVSTGGGGGRYFTGSRADGYACSVCHEGAPAPDIVIDGLPEKLEPGTRYELVLHWDRPEVPVALQLELATPTGAQPSVEVTPAAMLPAESRCESRADGLPAVYTFDVGMRRVVGVEGCGASSVAVSFVATGEPIDLAIAAVRSDASETAAGDGTFERRITLGQRVVASGSGGCSTSDGRGNDSSGWCVVASVVLIFGRRRITAARLRSAQ